MNQEPLPSELRFPAWRWLFNTLALVVSLALGFIGVILTIVVEDALKVGFLAITLVLLISFLLVPSLLWLFRAVVILGRRIRSYPMLHRRATQNLAELIEVQKQNFEYLQLLPKLQTFEILKAYHDSKDMYIVLKKRRSARLKLGAKIIVVHESDQLVMGEFEVTEVRSTEYYAIAVRSVDAVWRGYVKEQKEISVMPNMAAIYVLSGGQQP